MLGPVLGHFCHKLSDTLSAWHGIRLSLHMPRKNLIRSQTLPYHVTGRVNNREQFYVSQELTWELICNGLNAAKLKFKIKVHALVLMPNHFHLLVSTPDQDLGVVMQEFMRSITKTMNFKSGRVGRVFGARYHWSLVRNVEYFDVVIKYIYRNPIRAQIAYGLLEHPFSSLRWLYAVDPPLIEIESGMGETETIPNRNTDEFLLWLDEPFRTEEQESIKKGLRRTTFNPVNRQKTRAVPKPQKLA